MVSNIVSIDKHQLRRKALSREVSTLGAVALIAACCVTAVTADAEYTSNIPVTQNEIPFTTPSVLIKTPFYQVIHRVAAQYQLQQAQNSTVSTTSAVISRTIQVHTFQKTHPDDQISSFALQCVQGNAFLFCLKKKAPQAGLF